MSKKYIESYEVDPVEINRIYQMDCLEGIIKLLPDQCIDLVVTSPPYDGLRTYKSDTNLHDVGAECYRVMKEGAVMAVVIQDQTKDFGKSCTTARLIVDYVDKIGFKLFETIIWAKDGRPGPWWNTRFRVDHEYVLLFLKGNRPKHFDKEPLKIPAKTAGKRFHGTTRRNDGSVGKTSTGIQSDMKCRGTIWRIESSKSEGNRLKLQHPATFPDALPQDIITCFTKPDDIVLDPFIGSGTTAVAAVRTGRNFIGFETEPKYVEIANIRLESALAEMETEATDEQTQ
jgi:DNA modification methylase